MRLFLALVALLMAFPASAEKRIAISFDDAPRMPGAFFETSDKRTAALVAALKKAKVKQAGFFVTRAIWKSLMVLAAKRGSRPMLKPGMLSATTVTATNG
jgi:peptidoglycan/xylan/chitin deacetylase (PgdA/CDA1 family)